MTDARRKNRPAATDCRLIVRAARPMPQRVGVSAHWDPKPEPAVVGEHPLSVAHANGGSLPTAGRKAVQTALRNPELRQGSRIKPGAANAQGDAQGDGPDPRRHTRGHGADGRRVGDRDRRRAAAIPEQDLARAGSLSRAAHQQTVCVARDDRANICSSGQSFSPPWTGDTAVCPTLRGVFLAVGRYATRQLTLGVNQATKERA